MKYLLEEAKRFTWPILGSLVLGAIWAFSLIMAPKYLAGIIDIGLVNQDLAYIGRTGLKLLGLALVTLTSFLANTALISQISCGLARALRGRLYHKLLSFIQEDVDKFGISSLATRMTSDISQIQNAVDISLRKLYTIIVTVLGSLALAFSLNVQLTLVIVLVLPFLALIAYLLYKRSSQPFEKSRQALDRINGIFKENITGTPVIRTFNKEGYQINKFNQASQGLYAFRVQAEGAMVLLAPLTRLIMSLTVLFILYLASRRISSGTLMIGSLIALVEYVNIILKNVVDFFHFASMLPQAGLALARIQEVLDSGYEDQAQALAQPGSKVLVDRLTYSYPGSRRPVLQDISLEIAPGSDMAIIGSTGSGKTSLIRLIQGHYRDPTSSILYDGRPIGDYSNKEALFSYVPQRTYLFQGTLRDNLLLADRQAADETLWQALEDACMADYFKERQGLDSLISQGGSNLSGGQRQRLAIARALVADGDIFLFDDSFSALDAISLARVKENLGKRLAGKAVIRVDQRINLIKDAEKIYVLEKGRIVGQGSHQDLIKNNQVYQEIQASQLSEEERR